MGLSITPEKQSYCHSCLNKLKIKGLEKSGAHFIAQVTLTALRAQTNIAGIHEEGHDEAWIIAMSKKPDFYKALDME